MGKSKIEWTEKVWNPITGCTPVSEGCKNCYAERTAKRLRGRCGYDKDNPFKVTIHQDRFNEPLHWREPRKVFVCSMGDLFHQKVGIKNLWQILSVMGMVKKHTFMVLTKRPGAMRLIIDKWNRESFWPLSNVWLGVSVENQRRADERIPILLQIPAAVRFVSVEPMLEKIDLKSFFRRRAVGDCLPAVRGLRIVRSEAGPGGVDWVICGGESGPGRRPFDLERARMLRDQCKAADVPFFMKQVDKVRPIPDDLMIREYPKA